MTRRATSAAALALALAAAPLHGQAAPRGFMEEFEGQFGASASKLVALARAMPAETYDWTPGEGVATVAHVYMHVAHYNYLYPHGSMGRATPVPASEYERWEDEVRDKDQVVAILERSMEYVRSVARETSASDVDAPADLYGRRVGEWAVLFQLVAHMNEHLGQSIAYARMNGVVPPWSR